MRARQKRGTRWPGWRGGSSRWPAEPQRSHFRACLKAGGEPGRRAARSPAHHLWSFGCTAPVSSAGWGEPGGHRQTQILDLGTPSFLLNKTHPTPRPPKKIHKKWAQVGGQATACFCTGGWARAWAWPPPTGPCPRGEWCRGQASLSLFRPSARSGVEAPRQWGVEGWLEEVLCGCWPQCSILATQKQQAKNPGARTKTIEGVGAKVVAPGAGSPAGWWEEARCGAREATLSLLPPACAMVAAEPLVLCAGPSRGGPGLRGVPEESAAV